ncbi:cysteine desulfurase [Thiohalorhabdus denitrificans]|uniref:Cysteine desulfurase n=1 Tax=Thiohalorhabdus denitrificans TaxID=381306 RepID=A0A1G5GX98_9GAMM|nr:cysteine desulfurase [Thiohalorhabdus denitrificans]
MSVAVEEMRSQAEQVTDADADRYRQDFPCLQQEAHGKPLVYLDSAATSQKPRAVIDAISRFYETSYSNVHRGAHLLSERATEAYEGARSRVAQYIGAADPREIVFVRGATEAINLVAASYGRANLQAGDEILLTEMEHHSNIVPWQLIAEQTGAVIRVVPISDDGELMMDRFDELLSERTKLVGVGHVSNALGTINPVKEIVDKAHAQGAVVLVDGCQAAPRVPVDVAELGCDFYAFSGHKLYGPSGIGVLWGRHELLEAMPPYQGGGEMIQRVTFEHTTYAKVPQKFEAGTPNIAGPVGLHAAMDYVTAIGLEGILAHERDLLAYATDAIQEVPGVRLIGTAAEKAGILSFVMEGIHPHDIGTILDNQGIAVRTGHHCAQPVMDRFQVPATTRASFGLYNTRADVDAFIRGLHEVREILG